MEFTVKEIAAESRNVTQKAAGLYIAHMTRAQVPSAEVTAQGW